MPTYDILPDERVNYPNINHLVSFGFDPLQEIVRSNQYEFHASPNSCMGPTISIDYRING